MGKGEYLGEFEHLVLLAIARTGGRAGGADSHAELEQASERNVSLPAIHITVARLEKKGYLRTAGIVPRDEGGRPRRLFEVTAAGSAAMRATRQVIERLWLDRPITARPRR
jgi:DNA-binding MarR family transcriptional regulator